MVDVIKTLNIEYLPSNPASSFRGLHESFINYGGNASPERLTSAQEQAAVNIANGYYAVAGKPMAVVTFAPSGLQHAAMGIFGAFSGRTPTYLLCANIAGGEDRRPLFDWGPHAMTDPAAMVRDMLKWDDTPASLQHFAESAVRAYRMAMTPPRGPVMLVVDAMLQEESMRDRGALRGVLAARGPLDFRDRRGSGASHGRGLDGAHHARHSGGGVRPCGEPRLGKRRSGGARSRRRLHRHCASVGGMARRRRF